MQTTFKTGQRVMARFGGRGEAKLGVVTGDETGYSVMVQFEPCGSHWGCFRADVARHGDTNGWTEQEYRMAREGANCIETAAACERERRERFPDKAFSPLHEDWAQPRVGVLA